MPITKTMLVTVNSHIYRESLQDGSRRTCLAIWEVCSLCPDHNVEADKVHLPIVNMEVWESLHEIVVSL